MDPHNSTGNNAMRRQNNNTDGEERSPLPAPNHNVDDKTRSSGHPVGATADTGINKESSTPQSSTSVANPDAEMERFIREIIEDLGPDRFAVFVYIGLAAIGIISIIGFFLLSWSSIIVTITGFITFVVVSYIVLSSSNKH